MNTIKSIKQVGGSPMVNMGPIRLRQPIPSQYVDKVDPFILLHHYGPYTISAESNPFDLGPHPHRGFEPITLLYKGEQLHRDSLGNESLVKAGDVQWTTAGRGIIHAEGPDKDFVARGGELEGIQLWLNLPKAKKMMAANYQHVQSESMPQVFNEDKSIDLKVVAGNQGGYKGVIQTQTDVNVINGFAKGKGRITVDIPHSHESTLYLLNGEIMINNEVNLKKGLKQLVTFEKDGDRIEIEAIENSTFLILSGEPLNEPIAQYGPYVMNTQTEIMEAMRDYQQGKMGFLSD